jgi:hypothetical protein
MTGKSGTLSENSTNYPHEDVVLLLDSKPKIEQIKELITQTNPIIITFDYETHKLLLDNKINHQISDDYVTDDDLEYIQKRSFDLAKWFMAEPICELIEHDKINLGELFYIEFHYLLVPFLKKFVEISKVFSKFNSSRFLASSLLYHMITNFTTNVKGLNLEKNINNEFLYDVIKFQPKIGNKFVTINIKRSHYQKIKKISEKVMHYLFGAKKDILKKYVLFVEFDTIKYKELFLTLPQTSVNLMHFGRRRPTIWNYESFSIIQKSGCKIATLYDVESNNFDSNITKHKIVEEKIKNLLDQEVFLKNFFSISDLSFWNSIKFILLELCKKRFLEAISEIEIAQQLFKKYKFKSIVIWSESGFNEQIVIHVAKKFKIPIVLLQHGMSWETSEIVHMKDFDGVSPIKSDKFCVWGNILNDFSKQHGVSTNKLEILGAQQYDEIFRKIKSEPSIQNDFILLATSSPTKNIIQDLKIKTLTDYEKVVQKICEVISKQHEKLIIKLHPFQDELDLKNIVKKFNPEITIIKSGNIMPLIKSCKLLITIDLSTTILEAQILQKPVISVSVKDYGYGKAVVFSSGSCLETNIDNLAFLMNDILNNQEFRNNLIQKGNSFVNSYLSNQGKSSKDTLKFLENFE